MNQNFGRAKTEPEIQQAYEHNQTIIKSFIVSYESNRDVFKKFGSAISIFAEHLDEISKQKIPQTDQPLTQFSNKLSQIFKDMNYQIKSLGSMVIGVHSYFKDALQPIQQFKNECKSTYNDHVKLFNQVKKEYEQSNQKVADIQQKLQVYAKSIRPIATQDTQQYDFLKHQEGMAKNEQKIRYQNKKQYLQQLSIFMDKQQEKTQIMFSKYYKLVNDQAIDSFTQFNLTFNQIIDINKFTDISTSFISAKSFKQASRSKSPSEIHHSRHTQQVSHRSKSPKPQQQYIVSEIIGDSSTIICKTPLADRTNHTSRFSSKIDQQNQTNRSNSSFFSDKPSFKTAFSKFCNNNQNNNNNNHDYY